MSDSEHSHDTRAAGCCGHDHAHDAAPLPESSDPGSKSLADALRVSFVLLAAIMAFMVVGFLLTGLQSIESNEVGIVKVFGRVVRTVRPGLTYNWPFPIGQIEIVKTDEQRMTIYDFWFNEMPADVEKPLSQRTAASNGLRPGWDGALLTGDRYLLHVKIDCRYAVEDAQAYRCWVRDTYSERMPGSEGLRQVDPKAEMIRSAVCSAAIIAAAPSTADGLQTSDRRKFTREVARLANRTLRGQGGRGDSTGLMIRRIVLAETTWPLRASADYEAVLGARIQAKENRDTAAAEAEKALLRAAGPVYTQLVGKPWGTRQEDKTGAASKPYDLIGTYSDVRGRVRDAFDAARKSQLDAQAEKTLKQIDDVLLSNDLKGDASRLIAEARTYADGTKQRIRARVDQYERLWPEYQRASQLTMARLWAAAREEILAAAAEKYYISTGKGWTVLKINRDPGLVRRQVIKKLVDAAKARAEKKNRRK